ncbi:NERD domain-containing protein [Ruminococcaceae bacterium OttesenSCG-928-A16]|nr:NERD domain-containing protein [Ruminococcaceae bacterium OttesenSCG-928-A16]
MDIFWLVVSLIILVGMLGLLLWYIYRRRNPKQGAPKSSTDNIGAAVSAARWFAQTNGYRIIAPYTLTRGEKTTTLDALVIGYFGVLGVKALGYNGEVYGDADEEEWLQVGAKETRTYFANPIRQAAADVRLLRDALFAHKLKQVPVEVVCVFTSPRAQLALPRSTGHYTLKEFKALLRKDKYQQDNGFDVEKVEKALQTGK